VGNLNKNLLLVGALGLGAYVLLSNKAEATTPSPSMDSFPSATNGLSTGFNAPISQMAGSGVTNANDSSTGMPPITVINNYPPIDNSSLLNSPLPDNSTKKENNVSQTAPPSSSGGGTPVVFSTLPKDVQAGIIKGGGVPPTTVAKDLVAKYGIDVLKPIQPRTATTTTTQTATKKETATATAMQGYSQNTNIFNNVISNFSNLIGSFFR